MTKFWTITCSLALFLESCLGHQSDNKQYSTDYHRIIDSIAENYLKDLNADSLAVYIYDAPQNKMVFSANFKIRNNQLKYSVIPEEQEFEPSSLMKPYWAAILIENGIFKSTDTIPYQSQLFIYDIKLEDPINLKMKSICLYDAVCLSSNTGMAGFLNKCNGNSVVESELLKFQDSMHRSGVSLAFAAIGSGVKMRIPELLGFYAEVATIEKSDKWSVNTMEEIHSMLRAVVSNETATNLKSETVSVSGKTATYRTYGDTGYNYEGRFIGFNENQPNHIVMARVFNSKNKIHGSLTAGPIVADVIKGLHSESISKGN